MFLGTCSQGLGASEAPITTAYNYLSQYLQGSYFTGQLPPPDVSFPGFPFTAIIDLETGEAALVDGTMPMSTGAIVTYVESLNND